MCLTNLWRRDLVGHTIIIYKNRLLDSFQNQLCGSSGLLPAHDAICLLWRREAGRTSAAHSIGAARRHDPYRPSTFAPLRRSRYDNRLSFYGRIVHFNYASPGVATINLIGKLLSAMMFTPRVLGVFLYLFYFSSGTGQSRSRCRIVIGRWSRYAPGRRLSEGDVQRRFAIG